MKTVCWMDYGTQVQGVKINKSCPIYHVFMYHGCVDGRHYFEQDTNLRIEVSRPSFQNGKEIATETFEPICYEAPQQESNQNEGMISYLWR